MELYTNQFNHIMNRFPYIEHTYETIATNKVSNDYNLALAIPHGKKVMVWFTFHLDTHVCYLLDINRKKQVFKATRISNYSTLNLSMGTILYGTLIDINSDIKENNETPIFIMEDVYYYNGIELYKRHFSNKLKIFKNIISDIQNINYDKLQIKCYIPVMWSVDLLEDSILSNNIPSDVNTIAYNTHHIQYKTIYKTKPSFNVILNRKLNLNASTAKNTSNNYYISRYTIDYSKPQYKMKTVFQVCADNQFDIYHLFAYGKNNSTVYYNISYIPNYKISVFMNSIFRNIRENNNLDYIEESEDEDEFQNTDENKYVDINKTVLIECYFHYKFKKWVPIKVMPSKTKVVHINQLVNDFYINK